MNKEQITGSPPYTQENWEIKDLNTTSPETFYDG